MSIPPLLSSYPSLYPHLLPALVSIFVHSLQFTHPTHHGDLHNFLYLSTQAATHSFSSIFSRLSRPRRRPQSPFYRFFLGLCPPLCYSSPTAKSEHFRRNDLADRQRSGSKVGNDGHANTRLSCIISHSGPSQGLELSYHRDISTSDACPWYDPEGVSNPGGSCLINYSRKFSVYFF